MRIRKYTISLKKSEEFQRADNSHPLSSSEVVENNADRIRIVQILLCTSVPSNSLFLYTIRTFKQMNVLLTDLRSIHLVECGSLLVRGACISGIQIRVIYGAVARVNN